MGQVTASRSSLVAICLIFALLLITPSFSSAQETKSEDEKKPERLIEMAAEYPVVVVPPDEDVSMDIIFHNKGRSNENVEVWVDSKPKNWKARIKTYRYRVMGAHVPSGQDKTLTFEAEPDKGIKPGEYKFAVKAKTLDDRFNMAQTIVVKVEEKEKDTKVRIGQQKQKRKTKK